MCAGYQLYLMLLAFNQVMVAHNGSPLFLLAVFENNGIHLSVIPIENLTHYSKEV